MATSGDNPINDASEDLLGRVEVAKNLAAEIRELDASDGFVVAVTGPWGSGKTSLVNLVRRELETHPPLVVVDFNPWMFSGAEQLIDVFFAELAAQLKIKPGKIGKIAGEIEAYGDLLSPLSILPFVGGWLDRVRGAGGAIKKFQERRKESVTARRATLATKLKELDFPIVVVIDDIDRLRTDEIRDIFKLVRLTASFPNVIYLLAFDRSRVEDALSETGLDGRRYLEKIVQVTADVPTVPESVLLRQTGEALGEVIDPLGDSILFDENRWPDVLMEIIRPLIRNMRDVRRYAASVRGTVRALHAQVQLVDLLALEAIRVFLPDVFKATVRAQSALTHAPDTFGSRGQAPAHKQAVDDLLALAGKDDDVVRALISRVFPAGLRYIENNNYGADWLKTWLRERRVAHVDVLRLYLERAVSEELAAFNDAEHAFGLLADGEQLESFLRSIGPARREDVIAALETFEAEYPAEAVVPATVVLLNLLPELPERPRGFTFVDERLVVTRVVLRLLRRLAGPVEVEDAVQKALPRISTLSSKLDLLTTVGFMEGAGHKLVSVEAAQRLERDLATEIRSAAPDSLAQERDLLRVLLAPLRWDESAPPLLTPTDSPKLNAKILAAARSEVSSQALGSRAVRTKINLHWDALIKVYGGEEQLRAAVDTVRSMAETDKQIGETIALADRYLGGWRPDRFEDE